MLTELYIEAVIVDEELADRLGIHALLLRGGGCVRLSALPRQDHKSRSYHDAGFDDVWLAKDSNYRRSAGES